MTGLLVTALLVGWSGASLRQDATPGNQAYPTDTRLEKRNYLRTLMSRYDTQDGESYARYLNSPRLDESINRQRLDPVSNRDESRLHALQDRTDIRAYDGAPPVMPHSKNFAATMECLDCHTNGMFMGSRYARPISHAPLVNCEQCHVESKNMYLEKFRVEAPNDFEGLRPPLGGVRASSVAPPVMPHGVFMRINCKACHGPNGYRGLRTTHPERLNCVQCHGVATDLDQSSPYYDGNVDFVLPTAPARNDGRGAVDFEPPIPNR